MDAPRPRPFESGCGEVVNSEHFIEHLTREEAGRYLAEADRVCDPDGVLRTTTHNLRGFCELYLQREPDVLDAAEYGRNERELLCGTDHHGHGTLPGSVPFVDVVTPE